MVFLSTISESVNKAINSIRYDTIVSTIIGLIYYIPITILLFIKENFERYLSIKADKTLNPAYENITEFLRRIIRKK